jgi:TDG/mug DNA glycosylase family protein
VTAYRLAYDAPHAGVGRRERAGGVRWWVLPNPSGLNARWTVPDHAALLRAAAADAGLVDAG